MIWLLVQLDWHDTEMIQSNNPSFSQPIGELTTATGMILKTTSINLPLKKKGLTSCFQLTYKTQKQCHYFNHFFY